MSNEERKLKVIAEDAILKLSASSIKTYQQCPRKYYFNYLEKPEIPEKDWAHLTLGNFVHDVLEYFHNILIKYPKRDQRKLMSHCCKKKEQEEDYKTKMTPDIRKQVREMLLGYLDELELNGLPNVQSNERSFNIKLDKNLLIRGKIDRVDLGVDGHPEVYHIIDYKGLAINTPIPTPSGWTTMEEVKKGDYVLGKNGKPTKVIVKSKTHNRPCYQITLSDNSKVICDNVHLWNIGFRSSKYGSHYDTTIGTDELYKKFSENQKTGEPGKFVIENANPLQLSEKMLPINPWLLGAWLGDGISKSGGIVIGGQDLSSMKKLLQKHWGRLSITKDRRNNVYTATCVKPHADRCSYGHIKTKEHCKECSQEYRAFCSKKISRRSNKINVSLRTLLRKNNLLHNKHIPDIYLRGSYQQRLALLQGLMDTDGSWNPLRKHCVFISSKENLANSVAELVKTLGITVQTFTQTSENKYTSYRVEFRPVEINPFQLARKKEAVEASLPLNNIFAKRRYIKNIEKVKSVPTQCIAVDAEDSLYLCGNGMCPTHNTGKSRHLDEFQLLVYGIPLLDDNPELESYQGSYLALKENMKWISNTFTRTDVEKVKEKIRGVARQIREDRTWEPRPQFLCSWCDYETVCDAAPSNAKRGGRTKPFVGGEIDWD